MANWVVLDSSGNAIKIKADRFFVDQHMVFFQEKDDTGGFSEVAVVNDHAAVFAEENVIQG